MKSILERKKGIALNQAFGAVLTLVLVGVLVIIAIVLFVNLGTSFVNLTDVAVTNESVTPTDAGVKLLGADNCSAAGFAITEVLNGTTSTVITSPNYTVTTAGVFSNLTSEFVGNAWNVSYTFNDGGAACVANQVMITQFGTYPTLVGLVGTIIFLGLVIGVLVASFVFGGRREGV